MFISVNGHFWNHMVQANRHHLFGLLVSIMQDFWWNVFLFSTFIYRLIIMKGVFSYLCLLTWISAFWISYLFHRFLHLRSKFLCCHFSGLSCFKTHMTNPLQTKSAQIQSFLVPTWKYQACLQSGQVTAAEVSDCFLEHFLSLQDLCAHFVLFSRMCPSTHLNALLSIPFG